MSFSAQERAIPPNFDYDAFSIPENVSLNFNLSSHWSAAELPPPEALSRTIKQADVVILEALETGSGVNDVFRKISQGDARQYQDTKRLNEHNPISGWTSAIMAGMYATRTPVISIDVHNSHPTSIAHDRALDEAHHLQRRPTKDVSTEKIAEVSDMEHEALRLRDQIILNNLQPGLMSQVAPNKRLRKLHTERPLEVEVFYGSVHRSLLDAVVAKNDLKPVAGFDAKSNGNVLEDHIQENLYAQYLRGLEKPREAMLRKFAETVVLGQVIIHYPQVLKMPSAVFIPFMHGLIETDKLEDLPQLAKEILAIPDLGGQIDDLIKNPTAL